MISSRELDKASIKEFISTASKVSSIYTAASEKHYIWKENPNMAELIKRLKDIVDSPRFLHYTKTTGFKWEKTDELNQQFKISTETIRIIKAHCKVHMRNRFYKHPEQIKLVHDTLVNKLFCDNSIYTHAKYHIFMDQFIQELNNPQFKQALIDIGMYPEVEIQLESYNRMQELTQERNHHMVNLQSWSLEFQGYRNEVKEIIKNLYHMLQSHYSNTNPQMVTSINTQLRYAKIND